MCGDYWFSRHQGICPEWRCKRLSRRTLCNSWLTQQRIPRVVRAYPFTSASARQRTKRVSPRQRHLQPGSVRGLDCLECVSYGTRQGHSRRGTRGIAECVHVCRREEYCCQPVESR